MDNIEKESRSHSDVVLAWKDKDNNLQVTAGTMEQILWVVLKEYIRSGKSYENLVACLNKFVARYFPYKQEGIDGKPL